MSSKRQPRLIQPNCHRPINWVKKAVQKALLTSGFLIAQVKEDGIRIHAWIDDADQVRVVTREGIEIRSLVSARDKLYNVLSELPDGFCVDGEVVVQGVTFEEGSGLLRTYAEIQHEVKFYLWDAFPLDALLGAEYDVAYQERINTLVAAWCQDISTTGVEIIEGETVHTMQEIEEFFEDCRENGKEGAVVKCPDLPVIHGKRTGQWKMKGSETEDGIIRGLVWGTPGLGNEGLVIGFTVELESGVLCDVTGLSKEAMRKFTDTPPLGRYVEVGYMEKTAGGSLRHPFCIQLRDLAYSWGIKS